MGGRHKIKQRKVGESHRKVTDYELKKYLSKKIQKKVLKNAKKLKSVLEYSNDSNPFNDANLNERFVWKKKIEHDVIQGAPLDAYSLAAEEKRQQERMEEIERAKKRREQRALEKTQHEDGMALLARERARSEFQDWEKKEADFLFDQSKVRSAIRLREGRAKPIDVLTNFLSPDDDIDMEINEPCMVLRGLSVEEMKELRNDIQMHLLDRATTSHAKYWEALLIVCDWELAEARRKHAVDRNEVGGEELPPQEFLFKGIGLHSSIEEDVKKHLQGMSLMQLEEYQTHIESQMQSGKAKVVEFWEDILKLLRVYKAEACLKETYALKQERSCLMPVKPESVHDEDANSLKTRLREDANNVWEELEEDGYDAEANSFSPELIHGYDSEDAVDPLSDKSALERKRAAVVEEQKRKMREAMASKPTPAEGSMEEGYDVMFGPGAEVSLDSKVHRWHDKHRPRKPKYYNRVHTSYEWNPYNRTHYNNAIPPPKFVEGYKFDIFYPDLLDKTKTPKYHVEADGSSRETCVIRFEAGPPYEDIAFRIANKEWEYSRKKGYKCKFERGVLSVHFNFKRYRYRR